MNLNPRSAIPGFVVLAAIALVANATRLLYVSQPGPTPTPISTGPAISLAQPVTHNGSISLTVSSTSGAAPLTVWFGGWTSYDEEKYAVDFGDGTASGLGGDCAHDIPTACGISHTYETPGIYFARLSPAVGVCGKGASGPCVIPIATPTVSAATITVTGTGTAQPSATIDQSSLTTGSATPTITGAFTSSTGAPAVVISTGPLPAVISWDSTVHGVVWNDGGDHGGGVTLFGNRYSDAIAPPPNGLLPSGTYYVGIYNKVGQDVPSSTGNLQYNETLLTSGTFIVTGTAHD